MDCCSEQQNFAEGGAGVEQIHLIICLCMCAGQGSHDSTAHPSHLGGSVHTEGEPHPKREQAEQSTNICMSKMHSFLCASWCHTGPHACMPQTLCSRLQNRYAVLGSRECTMHQKDLQTLTPIASSRSNAQESCCFLLPVFLAARVPRRHLGTETTTGATRLPSA
eukprot:1139018-Pelagomonas_calceolata.AAC.19